MEILGYIVQYFDEDKLMPETGYKHLFKMHSDALSYAKTRMTEYITSMPNQNVGPFEAHTPTKKHTDDDGYSIVFRNAEIQIWIEAIIL
jgi:hypothetical protein